MAKITANYSRCSLYVKGMNFDCPMCGAKVLSGNRHECGTDVEAEKAAEAARPKEGWAPGGKKWHYFKDRRSLCGRYAVFAQVPLEQGDYMSVDNCAACFRRRQKLAKLEAARG